MGSLVSQVCIHICQFLFVAPLLHLIVPLRNLIILLASIIGNRETLDVGTAISGATPLHATRWNVTHYIGTTIALDTRVQLSVQTLIFE